jgi:hypothetical protein
MLVPSNTADWHRVIDDGNAVSAAQPWQSSRVSAIAPSSGGSDARLEQLMSSSSETPGHMTDHLLQHYRYRCIT